MNRYSRIKAIGDTGKPTCIDLSDPLPSPDPTQDSSSDFTKTKHADQMVFGMEPEFGGVAQQIVGSPNKTKSSSNNNNKKEEDLHEESDQACEERFSVKLRRNSSVSSANGLQTATKRVLSLTRSSSVSERYSRIHNQSVASESSSRTLGDLAEETRRSSGKKNRAKRGSLFRSCKKLFGF